MIWYNAFNVYRRELAPGTVSLTGDRAQGDDSKHWANSKELIHVSFLSRAKERAFHDNPNHIHTELTFINP